MEFSIFLAKNQPKRWWTSSSLLLCTQCARRYFVAGSPPCQDGGEGSSTGWGKLQDTSCPVFSDIATFKRSGRGGNNHCNSGEKWYFNSCDASIPISQASYSLQVFLRLLPCCWRQEQQLTPQRATKAMPEVLTKQEVRHQTWTGKERHHQIISPCRDLVQTCLRDNYL